MTVKPPILFVLEFRPVAAAQSLLMMPSLEARIKLTMF